MINFAHRPAQTTTDDDTRTPQMSFITMFAIFGILVWLLFRVLAFEIFADYEFYALILLISAPIGYLFYKWMKKDWLIRLLGPHGKSMLPVLFTLIFSMGSISGFLYVNSYNVTTKGQKVTFTITDKYKQAIRVSKSLDYKYYVEFPHPDFVPLPFFITDAEAVTVSDETYEKIVPNKSQITFIYRIGNLGIPFSTKHTFTTPD